MEGVSAIKVSGDAAMTAAIAAVATPRNRIDRVTEEVSI
jgi:hypothetical protein